MVHNPQLTLFLSSLSGGGAEKVMLSLAEGFLRDGITINLVLVKAQGPLLKEIPKHINLVDFNSHQVLASLPKLTGYLRKNRPYALLSTLTHVNILALWAKKLARVSTKVYIRESTDIPQLMALYNPWKAFLNGILIKNFYPRADGIIAGSHGAAENLQNFTGISPEKIKVIYNPVINGDLKKKAGEIINHPWFGENRPPVILAAGRLSPEKDYPTLIQAFRLVRRQRSAKLIILGEGKERNKLAKLIHHLSLSEDVSLPGFVMNPYVYMANAAVFVLSSLLEGLPGVLVQAMACGCRLVSTDCPSGPREILRDGRYGKLVPLQNPEEMATAILESLTLPVPTPDWAWLQQFTWEEGVKNYYKVMFS